MSAESKQAPKPVVTSAEFKEVLKVFSAWEALKRMGWQEPRYFHFPPPFTEFELIELGSTGIHRAVHFHETDDWRSVCWINGDSPSQPFLVRNVGGKR
jgi:hypothetical protein